MTAQDGGKVMITNHTDVIHDQVTVIVHPMVVIVTVTAHEPALQATETSPRRSAIGTKSCKTPRSCRWLGVSFPLSSLQPDGMGSFFILGYGMLIPNTTKTIFTYVLVVWNYSGAP